MFITKKQLEELIDKKIKAEFESWGFQEEEKRPPDLDPWYCWWSESERIPPYQSIEDKLNCLLKHLKLEYYKKEIKETNGEEKEYVQEGFRKIKVGKNSTLTKLKGGEKNDKKNTLIS